MIQDVYFLSAVRSPIGSFGGSLAGVPPTELAARVGAEAITRASIEPERIGQTVFGNVLHTEPRDMYLSRVAAIDAGVPETSPALTLNRLCGSGLQAIATASDAIRLGHTDTALAGGVENMSRAGHLLSSARFGQKMGDACGVDMMTGALTDPFGNGHMGVTAENVAAEVGISREDQDALALASHQKAAHAIKNGYFRDQILCFDVRRGRNTEVFDTDEHHRACAKPEDFSKLRPAFQKDGTVTAGNSSGINDGAAAVVLASGKTVLSEGLEPMARLVTYGLGGVEPKKMGLGPIPAVQDALSRAGMTIEQFDVIESNEAFAAQACAVTRLLKLEPQKVNPNGGAIALGHPIGASGAIILIKLLFELIRTGGRFGLATMCIGGGQGIAMLVEACTNTHRGH